MSEETVIRPMDLPEGQPDAVFFADLNVVGVRRGLSCEEASAAIDDLQVRWRRQHFRLIDTKGTPVIPAPSTPEIPIVAIG